MESHLYLKYEPQLLKPTNYCQHKQLLYYFVHKFTCHSHEPKSPVLLHQTIKNVNYKSLVQRNRKIALTINCLLQKLTIKSNTWSREFEQHFGPRNKLIFKTPNACGDCCDRGMFKLQIDGYIFMYHTQPMKFDQILSFDRSIFIRQRVC